MLARNLIKRWDFINLFLKRLGRVYYKILTKYLIYLHADNLSRFKILIFYLFMIIQSNILKEFSGVVASPLTATTRPTPSE